MAVLIIKENGYKISNNDDDLPNAILAIQLKNYLTIPQIYQKYRLTSNDVDFHWGYIKFGELKCESLLISYKDTELERYMKPNCQLVVDYLNKYESFSKKDIEKLVKEGQEVSKTQLELEIESLQVEKESLLEQISILKKIEEKKAEIKVLLSKLND